MKTTFPITVLMISLLNGGLTYAQSGHPMNSVDTTPGTTAPIAPTDPVRPDRSNGDEVRLPGVPNDLNPDAGSSKADRKVTRRKKKLYDQEQQKQIFPNERAPRIDPTVVDPE